MQLIEVSNRFDLKRFIRFPYKIFQDAPQWVPPMNEDEWSKLDPNKSPFVRTHRWKMWMVLYQDQIVGRIWAGQEKQDPDMITWSWWDQINDVAVTKLLFQAVENWANEVGGQYLEGPTGFTAFDKNALLTDGFDELPTIAEHYHKPYYKDLLHQIGIEPFRPYLSYRIQIPEKVPDKIRRMSQLLQERNGWMIRQPKSQSEIRKVADEVFDLINRSHHVLEGHKPIPQHIGRYYVEGFLPLLLPQYCCLVYKEEKLIGFGIALPSYSRAFQKMKGKIWPLGWWQILKTKRRHEAADLLLIGVEPKYQKKGVTACIFEAIMSQFIKRGIRYVESNPELEDNLAVQTLWKDYHPKCTKKRMIYRNML